MKIIAYKNSLIGYNEFIINAIKTDYINGMAVPISRTKDNKIIVFDDNIGATTTSSIEVIQKSTITDLQQAFFFNLDNLLLELSKVPNYNKELILYVYPLITPPLSNDTYSYINNLNKEYITQIKNIIDNYPTLNIALTTNDIHLLQIMKQVITNHRLGLIVSSENLNYLQVDFYAIRPILLDEIIIKQELDRGNEIYILITSNSDLSITYNFFFNNPNSIKNEILPKLAFTTGFPEIFYNLFNK